MPPRKQQSGTSYQANLFAVQLDIVQVERLIRKRDLLAIRRPERRIEKGLFSQRDDRFLHAFLIGNDQVIFATGIRKISDRLAIRRPGRIPLRHAGSLGQIADFPLLCRDSKNISPGLKNCSQTCR